MNRIKIEDIIKKYNIETYENKIYCFKNLSNKESLKKEFTQGDINEKYTEVLIDGTSVTIKNSPIFIYGEYSKFSREMSQTPLKIKGSLKTEKSVSDFTTQIKDFFGAKKVNFISGGREDIDVRMLGKRPFLLKVIEPSKNLRFNKIELILDRNIDLFNLKEVSKDASREILNCEANYSKIYRAYVVSRKRLNISEKYILFQRTPLRVLHRRSDIIRKKYVNVISYRSQFEDDLHYYIIDIETAAGTYVKEFVHGDFGRTMPSLSSEDNLVDILDLDVLSINFKNLPKDYIL